MQECLNDFKKYFYMILLFPETLTRGLKSSNSVYVGRREHIIKNQNCLNASSYSWERLGSYCVN